MTIFYILYPLSCILYSVYNIPQYDLLYSTYCTLIYRTVYCTYETLLYSSSVFFITHYCAALFYILGLNITQYAYILNDTVLLYSIFYSITYKLLSYFIIYTISHYSVLLRFIYIYIYTIPHYSVLQYST